jgi:ABC-type nickel/cobalt efflux system permease component RcnA
MSGPQFLVLLADATRRDYLARLLHQQQITPGMMLAAMGVAFALGAAHALTPGHGKTIVAAYLVGTRGTVRHAALLGAIVTFTHTITVFALGLCTLFLFQYIVPADAIRVLGAISGISIVLIGGWMLYRRLRAGGHGHHHHHHHHHGGHDHHDHESHGYTHSHDDIAETCSTRDLIALGVSGGLVPCESALVLLLSAIALGRVGLGLILLVAFSLGLAIVLMGIGILVIYAKHLLPKRSSTHGVFRWLPVVSGAVIVCVGLIMTAVSLGWIAPKWMTG